MDRTNNYILEYKFWISSTRRLNVDKKKMPFNIPNTKVECSLMSAEENKSIGETNQLIIKCEKIDSIDNAETLVDKIENALLWFSLNTGVPIYEHKNKGYVNLKIFGDSIPEDVHIINDDKIQIYEDKGKKVKRAKVDGKYHISQYNDKENFKKFMFEGMIKNDFDSDKQNDFVVLELYNRAAGEAAEETSFLFLITIIEILADNLENEKEIIKIVEDMMQTVKASELSKEQKQKLNSRIGKLKRKSIQDSCIKLLSRYRVSEEDLMVDKSLESFVRKSYDIRSNLVHEGNIYKNTTEKEFRKMHSNLKKVVKKLLVNYFQ